jgi:hypothetical protein
VRGLVQRVIGAAPGVRVLAASREGLGVPGSAQSLFVRCRFHHLDRSLTPEQWMPARRCASSSSGHDYRSQVLAGRRQS